MLEDSEYRKDLEKQKTEFNDVEEPKLHDYELGDLSKLYSDTLEKISPYNEDNEDNKDNSNIFKGVRYKPLIYLKKETIEDKRKSAEIVKEVYGEDANFDFADLSSNNIAKFMRHLLVRRFESSIFAFKKSVDNMIAKYENIKMWISKNRYTIYKRGDVNYEDYSEDDNDIMIKDNSKKILKSKNDIEESYLIIKGANKHNLKNISLTLPKNKINVITGVSGSGKTSLAFETIFKEGQRRFVE